MSGHWERRDVLQAMLAASACSLLEGTQALAQARNPELILKNGRITTLDESWPSASVVAILDGRFVATWSCAGMACHRSPKRCGD